MSHKFPWIIICSAVNLLTGTADANRAIKAKNLTLFMLSKSSINNWRENFLHNGDVMWELFVAHVTDTWIDIITLLWALLLNLYWNCSLFAHLVVPALATTPPAHKNTWTSVYEFNRTVFYSPINFSYFPLTLTNWDLNSEMETLFLFLSSYSVQSPDSISTSSNVWPLSIPLTM